MNLDVRLGDCLEVLEGYPENHFDACVTDPPYGLEFMGKEWDKLGIMDAWRVGAGFSKPGIGERDTAWTSFGAGDTANATCAVCGGRMRGAKRCTCEKPDWRVKGGTVNQGDAQRIRVAAMQKWHEHWAREVLRVLKPGGHLLAFGGTRTYHRLTCALEDAGFEIRDTLVWLYGSGFPKSLDVSKAIDERLGAERPVVGHKVGRAANPKSMDLRGGRYGSEHGDHDVSAITGAATEQAARWDGWGTALKPAWEPIILARKPPKGTIAENVLTWGVGGLNINATRIPGPRGDGNWAGLTQARGYDGGWDSTRKPNLTQSALGRWPANVILDEEAARQLDTQTGILKSGSADVLRRGTDKFRNIYHPFGGQDVEGATYGDSGGASRFFCCAKADREEREKGCEDLPVRERATPMAGRGQPGLKCKKCGRWKVSGKPCVCPEPDFETSAFRRPPNKNTHPTVKPVALMRYLVRLVTPPRGTVLDPFAGSGTTLIAAGLEGFDAVGVEKQAEYVEIAKARMRGWFPLETSTSDR